MPYNASSPGRPGAFLTLDLSTYVTLVAIGVWGLVGIVELWGLCEAAFSYARTNRSKINWEVFELRILLFMQIITFYGLLAIEGMSKFLVPFPSDVLDCDAMAKMNGIIYCFLVQATYLFFVKKSMLVAGFEKGVMFRRIQWVTKWGLLVFMPIFAVPLSAVLNVGIISEEGICLQLLSQIWFPTMFIFGNVGLSGALLYLFVAPLWNHYKQNSGDNKLVAKQMERVIKKNLYLTTLMVVVTTLNVILFCVFISLALKDPDQYDFLLMAAHIAIITDCFIMCLCTRMMTTIWLPVRIKRYIASGTVAGETQAISNAVVSPEDPARVNSKSMRGNTTTDTATGESAA